MLALSERLAADQGLNWVFCDTDSLAMAKPEGMGQEEFHAKGQNVIDWFEGLNPYQAPGSILKVEDANFGLASGEFEPLYCLAISAKRYALYNLSTDGKPILRKASAHGLGHLMAPYGDDDAPNDLPAPVLSQSVTGVSRWQHDLWFRIVRAALGDTPDRVPLDYHPAFQNPCISRYGATSPHLLKWVDHWNDGKPYSEQIKPFGFLISFTTRSGLFGAQTSAEIVDPTRRGPPSKYRRPKPVAPFDRDSHTAVQKAFDRITGQAVCSGELKTYGEALAQFHLSTEDKFENGDFGDHGETRRRYIFVKGIGLIGKEANKVGVSGEADPVARAQASYGDTEQLTHQDIDPGYLGC